MWKGGSEQQLMTPDWRDPADPADPLDPAENSGRLDFEQHSINLATFTRNWAPQNGRLPKMVFGHNLALVAPFELPMAGICIEFRRASFIKK